MTKRSSRIMLLLAAFTTSCNFSQDQIRMMQYTSDGQQLYNQYCSNCHQENGTGLGTLYPPIAQSDFLSADIDPIICLIRNGREGQTVINGITYNQPMPANKSLTALEIAEITTYLIVTWTEKPELVSVIRVEKSLGKCP